MSEQRRIFTPTRLIARPLTRGDGIVLAGIAVLLYVGARLALGVSPGREAAAISLNPRLLPYYAGLSVGRMAAAYALSMLFTLVYGYVAARSRRSEQVLLPLLDVLQSVPILSFLPVAVLGLSAILPQRTAAEVAAVILIFTSQAWNMTFSWYQSLTTIPQELREASTTFRLNGWLRLKTVELPFAALGLIWNSVMSWAGGWFFLMAAEIFTVGQLNFRLPGLGAYLRVAADRGDMQALTLGLFTLVSVIVLLDQLVWRPLLAWADRFKLEMVESEHPPTSWFYNALRSSALVGLLSHRVLHPLGERFDAWMAGRFAEPEVPAPRNGATRAAWLLVQVLGGAALLYGLFRALLMLLAVPPATWGTIVLAVGATLLRVLASLLIALVWTVPLGVAIGTKPRLAAWLQPLVQIAASVPATALFPLLLVAVVSLPGGLNLAAVLLMLAGTQWYLLFNVIAGAAAIPKDLGYTADLLQLGRRDRWRTLILPALFPYVITGSITASGGAWNASIVAEYADFGGKTLHTLGIGAMIAAATGEGNYPLLLATTLSMVLAVVLINRLVWRRLYNIISVRYRME